MEYMAIQMHPTAFALGVNPPQHLTDMNTISLIPQQEHRLINHPSMPMPMPIPIPIPIPIPMPFPNQTNEIDLLLRSQNEVLRMGVQEHRKQQTASLMSKYESKIEFLMKHKDEQVVKASNRMVELQNFLKRMEIEKQTWQRVAQEKEAMVASLRTTIGRLRLREAQAQDAESWTDCDKGEMEEKMERGWKMICRCCNVRNACVIMMPCRHLCSCKDCHQLLPSCPVCKVPKKATIHVSLQQFSQ